MTLDTQMSLPLLQELLIALRANDADGYKSWLALGIEELGRDVSDSDSSFGVNGSQPNGQFRQTALMWHQQPDYAPYKEKLTGEGWLGSVHQSTVGEQRAIELLLTSNLSCLMFRIRTFSQSSIVSNFKTTYRHACRLVSFER